MNDEHDVLNVLRNGRDNAAIDKLSKGSPFIRCPSIGSGRIAVCRYDEAKKILLDQENFGSEEVAKGMLDCLPQNLNTKMRNIEKWLLYSDTKDKKALKSYIGKALSHMSARSLQEFIGAHAEQLIDGVINKDHIDIIDDVATKLPLATMCNLIGAPQEDADFLKIASQNLLLLTEPSLSNDMLSAIEQSWDEVTDYFKFLMKSPNADGLLFAVASYEVEGKKIDRDEAVAQCISLLLGAHETTIGLICNTIFALKEINHKQAIPSGSSLSFVNEVMRFYPPSKITARVARNKTIISDYTLEKGDRIIILFDPANRDPLIFDNAANFIPERQSGKTNLSFGYGDHFCLGANLAKYQASETMNNIMQTLNLDNYAMSDIVWKKSDVFRRMSSFNLIKN